MVNTSEEIMLTLDGKDNASQMFSNVDRNAQSMVSNITSAMSKVNTGLMSIGQVSDNLIQSLTGKSAMDTIFGTASKAETNKVLLKNMLEDVEKNYESFYETVDKTTDSSLTSMQELIPALNALNAATGATDKELQNITPDVANFGAAVLAQTGSVDQAQQAMMDLSKGYKGAFASLDQYGITEDSLKRAGYSDGDGLEKYMDAVTKVVGSTEELMETNQGLDALIGKSFSRAGKKIGNEFLPVIKEVKKGFIDLDNEMGGAIASSILMGTAGVEGANRWFWNITTTVQGVRDLKDAFGFLKAAITGAGKAAEATSDAINTISNVSDIGAGAAGIGSAAGAGAQAAKGASKGEKALEGGMDALFMADLLKGNKSTQKEGEKVLKELSKTDDLYDDIIHLKNEPKSLKQINKIDKNAKINKLFKGSGQFLDGSEIVKDFKKSQGNWGFTDEIQKLSNDFGTKLQGGLKSLCDIPSKTSSFLKSGLASFKNIPSTIGSAFKSLGGGIKSKFTSFGSILSGIKNFDFTGSIVGKFKGLGSGLNKGLYTGLSSIKSSIKGFNFKDALGGLKNAFTGLKGAKVVEEGVETVAEIGTSVAAAGPEMAAASAGVETAAVGATTLSGAFTSMIVPALALAATLIIMIPIFGVIAAEAMIVIRLLAELMEALSFDSINLDGAIKGISQVTTALLWVGAAMLALTAVNLTTTLAIVTSHFMGMTGPLKIATDALLEAAGLLKQFSSIGIDDSVANNILNISSSLGSIASAMTALTWSNIVTGFSDWIAGALGFGSVTEGLAQAKDDIIKASSIINEFSGITPLDDSVAKNIQNVCDSLASVGNAMSALRSLRDGENWDDMVTGLIGGIFGEGVDIQQALLDVKDDIIEASSVLAGYTGLSEIPKDVSTKIQSVSDTLTSVADAFKTLRSLRDDVNWDEMVGGIFGGINITEALNAVKKDIFYAYTALSGFSGLPELSEDIGTRITAVTNTLGKVSEAVNGITSVPSMEGFDISTVTTAITNVQSTATELAKLNDTTFNGASADTVLGSIQTTLQNLKDTLAAASGFNGPATSIGSQIVSGVKTGLSPLTSAVQGEVSSATNNAASTGWTGGSYIGTSTTNGMKSSLKLKSTMETEVSYALTAMTSKQQEFYDAGASLGRAANEGFQSTEAINPGSPGNLAHVMIDEVGYILDAMKNKYSIAYNMAKGLGQSIYDGFGNPSLDMDMFTNGGTLTAEHIGALKTVVSDAPEKTNSKNVTVIFQEGSIPIDARNYTKQEAQALVLTAMDTFDNY